MSQQLLSEIYKISLNTYQLLLETRTSHERMVPRTDSGVYRYGSRVRRIHIGLNPCH